MIQSANWQLQEAVYSALASDPALTSLLGGTKIYDFTPQRTKPPYITIGMSQERDWSTSTEEGREHIVTLHSWSDNRGRAKADLILETIKEIMTTASLSLANHELINLVYEFSEIRRDRDGDSLHGLARYRITTEPNS